MDKKLFGENLQIVSIVSPKIEELDQKLQHYIGYYTWICAPQVYETVMERLRETMIKFKPFLIQSVPIISQIVIMALGIALIPVLGPFGPLLVQFIGQLIVFVLKLVFESISDKFSMDIPSVDRIFMDSAWFNPAKYRELISCPTSLSSNLWS